MKYTSADAVVCRGGIPLTTCNPQTVAALEEALCQRLGEPRYALWFQNNTKFTWNDDLLIIGVPNLFYQEWLEKTFADDVRSIASELLGLAMKVRFAIDAELFQAARRKQAQEMKESAELDPSDSEQQSPSDKVDREPIPKTAPPEGNRWNRKRQWRSLKTYVAGSCNRLSHASAVALIESPEDGPNPLVVHGPVGTGKTHLLEGIYSGLRQERPDWRVTYVTAEDFTHRFVQSMRTHKIGNFRKQYRDCDALLLDDLNFLADKPRSQEEFLHTFNALEADGRIVVVSTDCHPRLLDQFTPELTNRLLGGAVVPLSQPDRDTRLNILKSKSAQGRQVLIAEEVLSYVADSLRGNVRELEGALHSLRHHSRVMCQPVDLSMAREVVSELLRHTVRTVRLVDVERAVCDALDIEPRALKSKKRDWRVSHPRMLAMYLARRHTNATYAEIGRHFGGRQHSTAVAAEKKTRVWLEQDEQLPWGGRTVRVKDMLEQIERELLR